MPTIFSHGVAAVAFGKIFTSKPLPKRFWVLSVGSAMLPDIDVAGFALGIRYDDMLGHRGLTHSLIFAFAVAALVAWISLRGESRFGSMYFAFVAYFFVVTASHGVLDAMTNGGLGVAFFAPFSNHRYFFPWRPIQVSPLGLDILFSSPFPLIWSELKWIWFPSAVLFATGRYLWTVWK
jgi:inner membrane protein